jgi:peptidoglycan/LPS O-acetylase OafA/YrhL
VEAFLYVFTFPFLIWTRSLSWRDGLYAALIVVGVSWESLFYDIHWPRAAVPWFLPLATGLSGFGLGFSLHSLMERGLQFPKLISRLAFVVVIATFLWHVLWPSDYTRGFLALGLTLLVVASVDPEGLPYRLLANRFFLYLGDISYSLYLWHIVVLYIFVHGVMHIMARSHLVNTIFGTNAAISIGIITAAFITATLSYKGLEVPFRRLIRDRFVRPKLGAHQVAD